jgi:hypothetical protein
VSQQSEINNQQFSHVETAALGCPGERSSPIIIGHERAAVPRLYAGDMRNRSTGWQFWAAAAILLLHSWIGAAEERIRYNLVSRDVVESRLRQYAGDNKQREATLKQLFTEAGCGEQHLSEQPVKGSKVPNIICVLPGTSEKIIIVGAHFDHVSEGDGVVDNWSGASMLPSLLEDLKLDPRKHTYIFIGFTDEEKGLLG